MTLSDEQQLTLGYLVTQQRPPAEIGRWLMDTCKLSFAEAVLARRAAIAAAGSRPEDYKDTAKPKEAMPKKVARVQVVFQPWEPKRVEFVDGCVSCDDPKFACACKVKTVDQIPF